MSNDATMTKSERSDLAKLARMRERVARAEVDQRAAELRADVEQQLSAEYRFSDEAWAAVTATAADAVRIADAEVARICRERGIPDEFRPGLQTSWYGRGRNAITSRRAELRKAAYARVEADAKQAKHKIAAASVEIQTSLLAAGMTTEAAREFLSSMPTPAQLMPPLDVKTLEIGGAR